MIVKHLFIPLCVATLLGGCMITSEGVRTAQPPPAVQGSNDAQGSPLSVPGAGMGVGSGNPGAPGSGGLGGEPRR